MLIVSSVEATSGWFCVVDMSSVMPDAWLRQTVAAGYHPHG